MLFQTLDRLKRQSVLAAIIMMSLGVVMLICPENCVNALVVTAGYIMIIFALVKILEFIAGKKALIHYIICRSSQSQGSYSRSRWQSSR